MDRFPRRRLLAVAVAGGVLAAVAVPQLVAADPAPTTWPVDIHPTAVDAGTPSGVAPSDPPVALAPVPEPVPALGEQPAAPLVPEIVEEAPDVSDVPEIPEDEVPEPAAEVTPPPVPADGASTADSGAASLEAAPPEDVTPAAGTFTVDVVPVDGADRFVTLRPVAGGAGVGPLAVGAETIVVELPAGVYDLLVEQVAHGGGAFVTRVRVTLDPGGQVAATCDPETLECAVVA